MSDKDPSKKAHRTDFTPGDSAKRHARLNLLQQHSQRRHVPSTEERQRHYQLITRLKWSLLGLAILLSTFILLWPQLMHFVHQHKKLIHHIAHQIKESGDMEKAVYRGVDSDGRPYMITAENARQIDDNRIELTAPEADIHLANGSWLYGRADAGTYMQDSRVLILTGKVQLYRSDGTLINGPAADVDLDQSVVSSPYWVHAESPLGVQDAESMFMDQKRGIIQFIGPGLTLRFMSPGDTPNKGGN